MIRNNRGIALITVILMVSVIVAATVELSRSSRDELFETAGLSDGIQLYYIAKSGFYGGEAVLAQDDASYDALTEMWAKMEIISPQSTAYFRSGSFLVHVRDETGKIPVNKLITGNEYNPQVREMLVRLLNQPEFNLTKERADELVDSIKDWLDADNEVTGRGAEDSHYRNLSRPYPIKNRFLDCNDDLLMIKGVTRELYYGTKETAALKDFLTVYGDGKINVNTAPVLVLKSLSPDISESSLEKVEEYRFDGANDLTDVNWFRKVAGLREDAPLYPHLSVKSDYFTVTSTGMLGNMRKRITGTVRRAQNRSVQLVYWKVE